MLNKILELILGGKRIELEVEDSLSFVWGHNEESELKSENIFNGTIIRENYKSGKLFKERKLLPILKTKDNKTLISLPNLIVKPKEGARSIVIKKMEDYPLSLKRKLIGKKLLNEDFKEKKLSYIPLLYELSIENVLETFDIANEIQEMDEVEFAHPDFIVPVENNSPVPDYSQYQWYLNDSSIHSGNEYQGVKINEAWRYLLAHSSNIQQVSNPIIAIIDDGLHSHSDYNMNSIYSPINFTASSPNSNIQPDIRDVHGTAIAGVIAATIANNVGIQGITNNAYIMPLKVTLNRGTRIFDLQNAIRTAARYNAQIINISMSPFNINFDSVSDAINNAWKVGSTVVCASGNYSTQIPDRRIRFPGYLQEVITVGACDFQENWIGYNSNIHNSANLRFGSCFSYPDQKNIDCCAPGTHIITLSSGERFLVGDNYFRGTSASAAIVSGIIGIMKLIEPNLKPEIVRSIIHQSCDPLNVTPDINEGFPIRNYIGPGRINALKVVQNTLTVT